MKGKQQDGRRNEGTTAQVVAALRRLIRAVDLHSRYLVTQYGLTGPQLTVLTELAGHGAVAVGGLARAIHLSQATVTGIVDRLEKRGLTRRQRSEEDKRQVLVWLTPAGAETVSRAPPPLRESFQDHFSKLADWEQTQILSSLQRLVAMMEAPHLDATPIVATGPIEATPEKTKAFLGREAAKGPGAAGDEHTGPACGGRQGSP